MHPDQSYDVLIIGGSYAGLSAALVLGRALRRVLVLDAGRPCNRQTPHAHGFLTRDGAAPAELAALARAQLAAYPTVQLRAATATRATAEAGGFRVETAEGPAYRARKLLLATGLHDELPPLPGFAECWGISVLHCPYCHGYEVHGQPLAVLGNGDTGFEFARLIHHWSPDLRLLTNGPSTLSAEQAAHLTARGVAIIEAPLQAVEHQAGQLHHLRLADGTRLPLTAMFARVPFRQSSDLGTQLGLTLSPTGLLAADEFGRTAVAGLYVAGDNSSPMRQLAAAVANGSKAAAFINHELIAEDF
ncbi:NAD(P)/FAD-dependent oxidoreductase [Hymenobacter jeollabukensis]|uniref:NAD(P)/FAD-dependent oxidoreductase n=1 Tax=Hymenobacter jeollabukensis TaxID=2025313 RepID=A0A5R8WMZ7_9BACT|nr:NAD(P)/FAD-dependent oxidoreductase [Hymenobacter jeollabukensis]TLM91006.1 NAD(P)/FAD-dependent oxidoreductase [Hymenobacter jeollabukensis]